MLNLTVDELSDLLMILGASAPLFLEKANDKDTPGIFKKLFTQYADGAKNLQSMIIERGMAQDA